MSKTDIDWTDHSLNPGIYGCEEVSPACANCYAAGMAHRLVAMGVYSEGITEKRSSGVHWSGKVTVNYDQIKKAFAKLPKRKPARVFVTSMADLFHEGVPFAFIDRVFKEMVKRPHLTFQVLTKRPERMAEYSVWYCGADGGFDDWPTNVWAGCTVEDQKRADERVSHLLQVPAEVRFLSCEPLVGPVNLRRVVCGTCGGRGWCDNGPLDQFKCGACDDIGRRNALRDIHWVIGGGESGARARPSNPVWFRSLRDQCTEAGVPFFFKQWGGWVGNEDAERVGRQGYYEQSPDDGAVPFHVWPSTDPRFPRGSMYSPVSYCFGRYGNGESDPKTLDGVEHREFPEVTHG